MANNVDSSITKTGIEGVFLIQRPVFTDLRGYLHEVYRQQELEVATGVKFSPVQCNHSFSKAGVIRGIHTENWNKLVYPMTGILYAPIVDLRPESPTFKKIEYITIDNTKEDSKRQALFIPKGGIGNSICVLGNVDLHYLYLVDEYWDSTKASGIAWDDPDLSIKWPIDNPIISERDRNNKTLREMFPDKFTPKG